MLLLGLVDGNRLFLFFASAFPGCCSDPMVFTQTTCEAILRQLLEVDFADLDLLSGPAVRSRCGFSW